MSAAKQRRHHPPANWWLLVVCLVLAATSLVWWLSRPTVYGAVLGQRALQLADNTTSATTTYQLSFVIVTAGTLGSVDVQFCANDPFPGTPCTAPPGLNLSNAILQSQTGPGGFTISSASTANDLILQRPPSAAAPGAVSFDFTKVVNPNASGSYYVRLQTFATNDASGTVSDYGGIAFAINNQIAVSAEVPPYLIFCTGVTITGLNCANAQGDFVDFGALSPAHSSSGTSQMLVATNSASGYNVTANGTTMTSGNNIIQALTTSDVSRPGTAQFGMNLTANATPSVGNTPTGPGIGLPQPNYDQPNIFRFVNGDVILAQPQPDITRVYTASYLVNVPATQAPGIYVTTLTYVCLANF